MVLHKEYTCGQSECSFRPELLETINIGLLLLAEKTVGLQACQTLSIVILGWLLPLLSCLIETPESLAC